MRVLFVFFVSPGLRSSVEATTPFLFVFIVFYFVLLFHRSLLYCGHRGGGMQKKRKKNAKEMETVDCRHFIEQDYFT